MFNKYQIVRFYYDPSRTILLHPLVQLVLEFGGVVRFGRRSLHFVLYQ